MLRRTSNVFIWSIHTRIIHEDGQHSPKIADAVEALRVTQQQQRLASLCGGHENNNLHTIVQKSSVLKQFVEAMPNKEELLTQPVLDRKQKVVSQLVDEQERRVIVAKNQLKLARKQLRMVRKEEREAKKRLQMKMQQQQQEQEASSSHSSPLSTISAEPKSAAIVTNSQF